MTDSIWNFEEEDQGYCETPPMELWVDAGGIDQLVTASCFLERTRGLIERETEPFSSAITCNCLRTGRTGNGHGEFNPRNRAKKRKGNECKQKGEAIDKSFYTRQFQVNAEKLNWLSSKFGNPRPEEFGYN